MSIIEQVSELSKRAILKNLFFFKIFVCILGLITHSFTTSLRSNRCPFHILFSRPLLSLVRFSMPSLKR